MSEREHDLKTWPEFYDAIARGEKDFEVRANDRPGGFEVGDVLHLRRFDPQTQQYTGESMRRRVKYVLDAFQGFGLIHGYVVMGLAAVRTAEGEGVQATPLDTDIKCEHCGRVEKCGGTAHHHLCLHCDRYMAYAPPPLPTTRSTEGGEGALTAAVGPCEAWDAGFRSGRADGYSAGRQDERRDVVAACLNAGAIDLVKLIEQGGHLG